MKILILGHDGMLGNANYKYFLKNHDVEIIENLRWDSIEYKNEILYSDAEFIINCVGAIPQKKYSKEYYQFLNVDLPIFLEKTGKKIIHPSTDCEFSGKLEYPNKYKKEDVRDADDEYGMSKARISELIMNEFKNTKMIRTSIIGHEVRNHFSLLDWFLGTKDDEILKGFANYYWNGITTLQWAEIAEEIILDWKHFDGITQVGIDGLNKYTLLKTIGKIYSKPNVINEFNMEKTINKMLESDFIIPSIEEQLMKLKEFYYSIKTEKCVNCGAETNVPIDMPIDQRKNYVEGAGQLCGKCYLELYDTREDKGSGNR
jgi:dTDP-4-dehydrorhamnose reductase